MARYELILRLDGALWLRIIFKPLLTPKGAIKKNQDPQKVLKSVPNQPRMIGCPKMGACLCECVFQARPPFAEFLVRGSLPGIPCNSQVAVPK